MFETVSFSANVDITEADPKPTDMVVLKITSVYKLDPVITPGETPLSVTQVSTIYHVGDPVPGDYGPTLVAIADIING